MSRCFKNLKPCPFSVEEKANTAFVFMPFRDELQQVYTNGIKETLEDLGWTCHRSIERFDTPEIICTICKSAQEASLIIADLTGRNPNVFLEVGLAFGLGKYVALISQDPKNIPFDTRTFRTIMYAPYKLSDLKQEIRTLAKTINIPPKLHEESPETMIEIAKRRREHSLKIKDGALKPWLSKIKEYSKIDAVYSKDSDEIVGVEPKDPTNLDFFDEAKSHLETKYPNVLEAWEELKHVTSKHNEKLAIVLEELRTSIIRELKMHCYYYSLGAEEPEEHIKPDKIAQQIYQEIESRAQYKRKWFRGKPLVTPVIISGKKFFRLEWGNNILIRNRDEKKVESSIPLINQLIETLKFKKEEKRLTKRKDEIYKTKREDFEAKIKDVIKAIELGKILEGNCRFCP